MGEGGLRIARVELGAPERLLGELAAFYGERLGLGPELRVGPDQLVFTAAAGEPFHHFALLVPGDGFEAAHAWIGERAELLGDVFPFDFWDAQACYFHDPAGNIVELIAHRGIGDGASGLLGISEIGVVEPGPGAAVAALERELGLELWSGGLDDEDKGLAFVGRKAHTLIVSGAGRGWLPTGRPSEPHPVTVTIAGTGRAGELVLPGSGSVVRVTA